MGVTSPCPLGFHYTIIKTQWYGACRLTPGKDLEYPIAHNLSLTFLSHYITILQYTVSHDQLDNALTCVITLQVGVVMYVHIYTVTYT